MFKNVHLHLKTFLIIKIENIKFFYTFYYLDIKVIKCTLNIQYFNT